MSIENAIVWVRVTIHEGPPSAAPRVDVLLPIDRSLAIPIMSDASKGVDGVVEAAGKTWHARLTASDGRAGDGALVHSAYATPPEETYLLAGLLSYDASGAGEFFNWERHLRLGGFSTGTTVAGVRPVGVPTVGERGREYLLRTVGVISRIRFELAPSGFRSVVTSYEQHLATDRDLARKDAIFNHGNWFFPTDTATRVQTWEAEALEAMQEPEAESTPDQFRNILEMTEGGREVSLSRLEDRPHQSASVGGTVLRKPLEPWSSPLGMARSGTLPDVIAGETVVQALTTHSPAFRRCGEGSSSGVLPGGIKSVSFQIGLDGHPIGVEIRPAGASGARCLEQAIQIIKFPRHLVGGPRYRLGGG